MIIISEEVERDVRRLCAHAVAMFRDRDYVIFGDSIEEDVSDLQTEVGRLVFAIVVNPGDLEMIDSLRDPSPPKPEPIPVAQQEGEQVKYCMHCEKPTVHVEGEWDGISAASYLTCSECGSMKAVIPGGISRS